MRLPIKYKHRIIIYRFAVSLEMMTTTMMMVRQSDGDGLPTLVSAEPVPLIAD